MRCREQKLKQQVRAGRAAVRIAPRPSSSLSTSQHSSQEKPGDRAASSTKEMRGGHVELHAAAGAKPC